MAARRPKTTTTSTKPLVRSSSPKSVNNLVVVSDLHVGCQLGLMPREGFQLDEGPKVLPSRIQSYLIDLWDHFWNVFVPHITRGEPYYICVNGDSIDGDHHGAVSQWTHNLKDQRRAVAQLFEPILARPEVAGLYWIRGTEAHVGKSGQEEEALAESLGAIPSREGQFARWELYKRIGTALVHLTHHIGTTGSSQYESTALGKEYVEACTEAGRWQRELPDVLVRSHRHRFYMNTVPQYKGRALVVVTPGWQAKTPFTYKLGMKQSEPQFGGIVIRQGAEEFYVREFVRCLDRPTVE